MEHHASVRYPAPAAVVLRMFSDADFHRRKLEQVGLQEFRILDSRQDADEFSIDIERKVAVKLPGVGKKASSLSTVTHTESWNRRTGHGHIEVQMPSLRLTMYCDSKVIDDRDGSVVDYAWTLGSKLPVVGRTVEKLVAANMDREAAPEHEAGIALLDDYR